MEFNGILRKAFTYTDECKHENKTIAKGQTFNLYVLGNEFEFQFTWKYFFVNDQWTIPMHNFSQFHKQK